MIFYSTSCQTCRPMCLPMRGTKVMLADHISPLSLSSPNPFLKLESFSQVACTYFKELNLVYVPPQIDSPRLLLRPFALLLAPMLLVPMHCWTVPSKSLAP